MSRTRSAAAKREHAASMHARRLVHNMANGSAGEWWRPVDEAPQALARAMRQLLDSDVIEQLLQRCPHDSPATGCTIVWPSIDDVRRCPLCWLEELRLFDISSTAECTLCGRPVGITAGTHFMAVRGRFILAWTACPTCLEHPPGAAA